MTSETGTALGETFAGATGAGATAEASGTPAAPRNVPPLPLSVGKRAQRNGNDGGENLVDRVPPHDDAAEDAVLGAMMLDPRAAGVAVELLSPDDFYAPRRRLLFRVLAELYAKQEELDELIVRSELEKRGLSERVGGLETVGRLMEETPNAANIERYCRLVRERADERELALGAVNILRLVHGEATEKELAAEASLLDRAEEIVYGIRDRRTSPVVGDFGSILENCLAEAERAQAAKRAGQRVPSPALPTRFKDLDRLFAGGLWPGELVIIAGRPSMGKTTLALNIARKATHTSRKPGDEPTPSAVFSLEVPREQIVKNILCAEARLSGEKMRSYDFDEEEYATVRTVAELLGKAPLHIDDTGGLTPASLRAHCRRLRHRENLGLVVVDYLQLMRSNGRTDSREQEVADISREMKSMARELNVPVIAVSQLNRSPESRTDKRPQLSDLRESGSLEQDADVVVLLYREEYYERQKDQEPDEEASSTAQNVAEAIVAKNRNGRVGTVKLTFFKENLRFEDYTPEAYAPAGGYTDAEA